MRSVGPTDLMTITIYHFQNTNGNVRNTLYAWKSNTGIESYQRSPLAIWKPAPATTAPVVMYTQRKHRMRISLYFVLPPDDLFAPVAPVGIQIANVPQRWSFSAMRWAYLRKYE